MMRARVFLCGLLLTATAAGAADKWNIAFFHDEKDSELTLVQLLFPSERRGIAMARAVIDGMTIRAARVKRPARNSPEWVERVLRSSADARDFVADLKKQLAQWSDRDD